LGVLGLDATFLLEEYGKIYGIELLNAHEQLQIMEEGKFILTDESTGKTVQLPISTGKS
jgi:uncharacterized protein YuzE